MYDQRGLEDLSASEVNFDIKILTGFGEGVVLDLSLPFSWKMVGDPS